MDDTGSLYSKWKYPVLLALCTVLALLLRAYNIGTESFWVDETFSVTFSQHNDLMKIVELTYADVHPPLYLLILHYFLMLPGPVEIVARLPSLIFGVLSIPAIYIAGEKLLKSKQAGIIAAFLLAISFASITYSQEARMYPLMIFLGIVEITAMYCALEENKRIYWALFTGSAVLIMYTHYYGFLLTGALLLWALVALLYKDWKSKPFRLSGASKTLVVSALVIAILMLPQVPYIISQSKSENVNSDIHTDGILFYPKLFYFLSVGGIKNPVSIFTLALTVIIGGLFAAGLLEAYQKKRLATVYMVAIIGITSLVGLLLTYKIRFCGYRYFIYLLLPYLLPVSAGMIYVGEQIPALMAKNGLRTSRITEIAKGGLQGKMVIIIAILSIIVLFEAAGISPLYSQVNVDLRDGMNYVLEHKDPSEKVIVINGDNRTMEYYATLTGISGALVSPSSYQGNVSEDLKGNVSWVIISDAKDRPDNAATIVWLENNTVRRASFSRVTVYSTG